MSASPHQPPRPIRLRVDQGSSVDDVTVTLADPSVTVAEVLVELVAELGWQSGRHRPRPLDQTQLDLPAAEVLHDGMRLGRPANPPGRLMSCSTASDGAHSPPHHPAPSGAATAGGWRAEPEQVRPVVEVAVVGGLDAGALAQLPVGRYRLGDPAARSGWFLAIDRSDLCEPEPQSWDCAGPTVEVVGGLDSAVALSAPIDPQARHRGYVHRPPRRLAADSVDPIELAPAPADVGAPPELSWATLLAPIPIALAMAIFFRPLFAIFAAMGPVIALARWFEGRRRYRKDFHRRAAEVVRIHDQIAADRADRAEAEAARRWHHHPHVAALWKRARHHSARLWERRPGSAGYLEFGVGIGPDSFTPELTGASPDPEIHSTLDGPIELRPVPHRIDLAANLGVGLFGERSAALAVARAAICQLATLHGPADLSIGVICGRDRRADWEWVKWLPHLDSTLVGATAAPIIATLNPAGSTRGPLVSLRPDDEVGPISLLIIDDPSADVAGLHRAGTDAGREMRYLAVASGPTMLPALCTALVEVTAGGAMITTPHLAEGATAVAPTGIGLDTAEHWARSLAPMRDPERIELGGRGDEPVRLLDLAGDLDELARRWAARPPEAPPRAAVGTGIDAAFTIDLVDDGPHALVAGTTGSGKSEFLRTLVLSLAVDCPPDQLVFVLIDFKGGGAFDVCARLPHVAGLITDLDESLIERVLAGLRAELMRREVLFRDLGVSSHSEAVRSGAESVPRLVIVIDEFAALAADHEELLSSIIDLAARGRSLGMHLVLATQRPSGVVDQKIRANTNLRVALRMQDPHDSYDVIGSGEAAAIDRRAPGRAIIGVGADAPVTVQTAYSGAPIRHGRRCRVDPFTLFAEPSQARGSTSTDTTTPSTGERTERDEMLEAITAAAATRGRRAGPLWAEPLPDPLDWIDLGARLLDGGGREVGLALGLVDLPDRQTQIPYRWDPDSGALVLFGASAVAAGRFLVSVGAAFAATAAPDDVHLYVIDGDGGTASPLAGLAHTGAYVSAAEFDRVERTLSHVEQVLATRRSQPGVAGVAADQPEPRVVLLIDNLAAAIGGRDELGAINLVERLGAIARDGSLQRVHLVVTARTPRDLAHRLGQQVPNRLIGELADPNGYMTLGLKARDVRAGGLAAMRVVDPASLRTVQLVEPPDLATLASARVEDSRRRPKPIRSLPTELATTDLDAARRVGADLIVPIGVDAVDVEPLSLRLAPGQGALVVGPAGSGRSTVLDTIAEQITRSSPKALGTTQATDAIEIVRVGPGTGNPAELAMTGSGSTYLVLVDDLEHLEPDEVAAIEQMTRTRDRRVNLVVAASPQLVRTPRSAVAALRAGGHGIVLAGGRSEADLFNVALGELPGAAEIAGRAHLVSRGRAVPAHLAQPADRSRRATPDTGLGKISDVHFLDR